MNDGTPSTKHMDCSSPISNNYRSNVWMKLGDEDVNFTGTPPPAAAAGKKTTNALASLLRWLGMGASSRSTVALTFPFKGRGSCECEFLMFTIATAFECACLLWRQHRSRFCLVPPFVFCLRTSSVLVFVWSKSWWSK